MSLFTIFVASLLGSPHCAGMCGGFVLFNSGQSQDRFLSHLLYNFGRLLTYLFLGLMAGALGHSLDTAGAGFGFQRLAAYLTGGLLIFWGILLLTGRFSKISSGGFRGKISSLYSRVIKSSSLSPAYRSLALGLLSTLLPCGWLYAFVAVAAGSGSAFSGALVMLFFWLGTLPILLSIGRISRAVTVRFGRYLPTITPCLLILAGFFALFGHVAFEHSHSSHLHGAP
ncbi:MAG: sulfite exporter TauE/SafE family protein [Bdellovibrionales bacterium]|nr:sulfite exporter TauE/SafE family protein [Bdellovibrionales bacterium]